MKPELKSITLPNGVGLPYLEQGDPAGVPVVLLHGYTDSMQSYEGVMSHLPPSLHAFAVSQRGHGDADRPMAGYRPRDFAADLAGFMDARQLGPVVVVGHSMGSTIARRFVIDYPERTLGLVLAGSFLTTQANKEILELWEIVSRLTDPIDRQFVLEFQLSTLAQPVLPRFLDMVVQESLKVPARVWKAALKELMEEDSTRELRHIQSPTWIVWGDQDAFCPRSDQEELTAAIEGSQFTVYQGAGHAFHWEEPARFAVDLRAFAEGVAAEGLARTVPTYLPGGGWRRQVSCA